MKDQLLALVFKLFGGKLKALVNSAIVAFVLWLISEVAKFSPDLAKTIDPQTLAGWILGAVFIVLNIVTNHTHSKIAEDLKNSLEGDKVEIPVKKAEIKKD